MHFLLTNEGLRWIHGIETRFLVKEVHFLLTNGGSGWIHGIGTGFYDEESAFFVNKWRFSLNSGD